MGVTLEHVACDLCGCAEYRLRYRKPDNWLWVNQFEYPVVECLGCGLVYVNPRPTPEAMEAFYPAGYHDNRNSETFLRKYEVMLEYLPDLRTGRVLDIGCARGDFLTFLKQRRPGLSLFGVDAYSDNVSSGDIHFFRTTLPACGFAPDFFDLVTAWAVFEHLHEPLAYFKAVAGILRPGGRFVFLVTNSESLYGRRAFVEDVPRHLYHFSEKTLNRYAEASGLVLRRCSYDDRIWDGRGLGTFKYGLLLLCGGSWEGMYLKRLTPLQKYARRLGERIDAAVFKYHWERRIRRSGVMIVECAGKDAS